MKDIGKVVGCLLVGILGVMTTYPVQADETPRLGLRMKHGLQAHVVKDGMRLGQGTLVSHEAHAGFRLWSEVQTSSFPTGHFVLSGKQNDAHKLRIRLVPRGLTAEGSPGSSEMVLNTKDDRVVFDVIADGEQRVEADHYRLDISGTALPP
ncbi:AfaD family invasin [Lonsdalea quercina]|uniref:AfaD family invasin n=1 Tax=Lonsdalea quercina TaxID=71657 RepID=UPI003974A05F